MKKRINILSVVVLALLLIGFVPYGFIARTAFNNSSYAKEHSEEIKEMFTDPIIFSMVSIGAKPANVKDEATGQMKEIWPLAVIGHSDQPLSTVQKIVVPILNIFYFLSLITGFVFVIKLIVQVNKGKIFDWRNVKLIRGVGLCMIVGSLASALSYFIRAYGLISVFKPAGYLVFYNLEFILPVTLIIGVVAFVIAEIFAMGIRQKEELELMI